MNGKQAKRLRKQVKDSLNMTHMDTIETRTYVNSKTSPKTVVCTSESRVQYQQLKKQYKV